MDRPLAYYEGAFGEIDTEIDRASMLFARLKQSQLMLEDLRIVLAHRDALLNFIDSHGISRDEVDGFMEGNHVKGWNDDA